MWYEEALVVYLSYTKHLVNPLQASIKAEKIEMNFTYCDGLDLIYYDIDSFRGSREKVDHLTNDENNNID